MNKYRIITVLLTMFSAAESAIAIGTVGSSGGPVQVSPGGLDVFWRYSILMSIVGWAFVGVTIVGSRYSHRSQVKSFFTKKGIGGEVYDLMMGMRGGGSRLALLKELEMPKHRQELAEITGIDWKEVDRQISVLEKYGLVKIYVQSGTVRMYQITEQGRLLLNVIGELK